MPISSKRNVRDCLTPYWKSECGCAVVYIGDCLDVMAHLEPNQFHAIITDPPYNLSFMGKDWDSYKDPHLFQKWFKERTDEMLRVAKPGAHLLSFGGTRTWHRMTCAIEDTGFKIRDCLMWLCSTGFPKGTDVSKDIDKEYGVKREITGTVQSESSQTRQIQDGKAMRFNPFGNMEQISGVEAKARSGIRYDIPVTEDAQRWQGWNTALKPAWEPIVVARKELIKNVAYNSIENHCGGMNVDTCRVGTTGAVIERNGETARKSSGSGIYCFNREGDTSMHGSLAKFTKDGRYPANLIHDGCLPDEIARFFYSAKAGGSDRPHGRIDSHPAVKPLDLMRYLVKLVCLPGTIILDPFMGSGSTGCAAIEEDVHFVGIEQLQSYADKAIGRLKLSLEKRGDKEFPALPTKVQHPVKSVMSTKRFRGL